MWCPHESTCIISWEVSKQIMQSIFVLRELSCRRFSIEGWSSKQGVTWSSVECSSIVGLLSHTRAKLGFEDSRNKARTRRLMSFAFDALAWLEWDDEMGTTREERRFLFARDNALWSRFRVSGSKLRMKDNGDGHTRGSDAFGSRIAAHATCPHFIATAYAVFLHPWETPLCHYFSHKT